LSVINPHAAGIPFLDSWSFNRPVTLAVLHNCVLDPPFAFLLGLIHQGIDLLDHPAHV
jgi:hypothetical protein